jgi:hypothetical protein
MEYSLRNLKGWLRSSFGYEMQDVILPSGGTTNQVLTKVNEDSFNVQWSDMSQDFLPTVSGVVKNNSGHTVFDPNLSPSIENMTVLYLTHAVWTDPYTIDIVNDTNRIIADYPIKEDLTVIRLPLLSDSLFGKTFKIMATRNITTPTNYDNMLSVYMNQDDVEDGASILIGDVNHSSLFSTCAGDYLEIGAEMQPDSTFKWRVVNFDGYWEDRD